jgi:ribonuclease P protein component
VSRKVGKAVQRNQVKRWLREILRQVPPPRQGPWDLVLIPNAKATEAGFFVLKEEVTGLFRKVAG